MAAEDGSEILRSQLEALPLPAMLLSHRQQILAANDLAEGLIGTELPGRALISVLRHPGVLDAVEQCLRSQAKQTARYLVSEQARDATYLVTVAYIRAPDGASLLLCFEDQTPLEQASQVRQDFVANVSHELRTPLTSLLGFIETLRGLASEDAAARERFLGIMHGEAMRMERLVSDLLSLSRVESNERVRPRECVPLRSLLDKVMTMFSHLAQAMEVTLQLQSNEAGHAEVLGDSDQLQQVFSNLIENAIRYGGAGKTVRIVLSEVEKDPFVRGAAVRVSVIDEGPGIDSFHVPRLTERFYRVDTHRSRDVGGTGLGLAIVKHIVNRHQGCLRISSEIGKGSEFKVILPSHRRSA